MDAVPKRKFHNPTPGYVGATVLDDDNKPKGMPVEPGGHIWLSEAEERLTAEAPRLAKDNPFIKEWTEETDDGPVGRVGVLVMSEEPARTILSDRHIPSAATSATESSAEETDGGEGDGGDEVTGAPSIPRQPPVEGQPGPDEIVGSPDAPDANDEHLARQAAAKQKAEEEAERKESPVAIGDGPPKGPEVIGARSKAALV